jgi:EpsI family protein
MGRLAAGRWTVLLALFAATAGVVLRLDRRPGPEKPAAPAVVPGRIGAWSLDGTVAFKERVMALLGTRDVTGRLYAGPEGRQIELVIVRANNNRAAFHPPEYCLTGAGMTLLDRGTRTLRLSGSPDAAFACNEMVLATRDRRRVLVWNWYMAQQTMTASYWAQQLRLVKDEFVSGTGRGAVVTLCTAIDGDDRAAAAAAHEDFCRSLVPVLQAIQGN